MKKAMIAALMLLATPAFAQQAASPDDLQAALAEANSQSSLLAYRAETFAAELAKAKREIASLTEQLKTERAEKDKKPAEPPADKKP